MKPVSVNFRPQSKPSRLVYWLAVAVCGLGALALFSAWTQQLALRNAQAVLEGAQQTQLAAARQALAAPAPKPYAQSALAMLAERELKWPDALRALEASAKYGVTLKSFEANAADGTIRAELVLSSQARIADYLGALSAGAEPGTGPLQWSVQQTSAEPGGGAVKAVFVARPTTGHNPSVPTPRGP